MFIRTFIRPAAIAIALTIGASSLTAFADDGGKADAARIREDGSEHAKHEKHFPMEAARFDKMVEHRIEHARAHLEKTIADRKVSDAVAKEMRTDFETGVVAVRAVVTRVEADGTVTKEEAKEVRDLAKELRQQAAAKYGTGPAHQKHAHTHAHR
jgi:hypothetical protein